jgi:hypothetical protein
LATHGESETAHGVLRMIAFVLFCVGVQVTWNGISSMDIPICVEDGPAIVPLIRLHYGDWQKQQEYNSRGR